MSSTFLEDFWAGWGDGIFAGMATGSHYFVYLLSLFF
jgi:hypothetical protein